MASVARISSLLRSLDNTVSLILRPISAPQVCGFSRRNERATCSLRKHRRQLHIDSVPNANHGIPTHSQLLSLPRSCPGCGAWTQIVDPDQPGFYTTNRKSVKAFIAGHEQATEYGESDALKNVVEHADDSLLWQLGLHGARDQGADDGRTSPISQTSTTPTCNRCHDLIHHHTGKSIIHPTVRSIQEIISESPYKYNHIYHVLDAADFPLSLVPSLQRHLSLSPQRPLNRRAKISHYQYGRKAEMSFIITRSDLLAPKKEQVDKLMPYIIETLRNALAGSNENVRLGNVRCVSSKRGWWTKEVKEDIWNRGGGGWMVGKVNVGKSNLFESVFPKGRNEDISYDALRHAAKQQQRHYALEDSHPRSSEAQSTQNNIVKQECFKQEYSYSLEDSLLPPRPLETPYPVLPLVSPLPGTTASPIRVPFGGGKGELIDLPGLSRDDLEDFVVDNHKLDVVMRQRIKPEQLTIKPGQSLLLGGLVRITSTTPDLTFLAYPFVPLQSHTTATEKAIAIHTQIEDFGVPTIAKPGIGRRMSCAGNFALKWDVTKQRAGPLTRKAAAGLSPEVLPFMVLSVDVLIEGCGWVEIVAQVRKRDMELTNQSGDLFDNRPYPRIEVYSPDGKHIGVRQPMGAWLLGGMKPKSLSKRTVRPRRSMKGVKKELKRVRRKQSS